MYSLNLEPMECLPQTEGSRTIGDIVISMQIRSTDVIFEARLVVMVLQIRNSGWQILDCVHKTVSADFPLQFKGELDSAQHEFLVGVTT